MNVSLKISRSINKLNYKILDKVFIHSKHVEYIYTHTHIYFKNNDDGCWI